MIIATFGPHLEDNRPQMVVGINTEDLLHMVQTGHVYLNIDEPDEKPLPVHLILMFGPDDDSLGQRITGIAEAAGGHDEEASNDANPDV